MCTIVHYVINRDGLCPDGPVGWSAYFAPTLKISTLQNYEPQSPYRHIVIYQFTFSLIHLKVLWIKLQNKKKTGNEKTWCFNIFLAAKESEAEILSQCKRKKNTDNQVMQSILNQSVQLSLECKMALGMGTGHRTAPEWDHRCQGNWTRSPQSQQQ